MKKNTTKRRIYIQIFSAFFAIYLVVMGCFSIFFLFQEKKVKSLEFQAAGMQGNQIVQDTLKDYIDSNYKITDVAKVKREFVSKSSLFTFLGAEAAIFTGDYNLIYNTNDNWLCSYTEYSEGSKRHTGYAHLNPYDWLKQEDITELEDYLYSNLKPKKIGDLAEYSVELEGFWLDDEKVIPKKISVTPMYAGAFDENGTVTSSSGTHTDDIIYTSNYIDTKDLPYFEYGNIRPNNNGHVKSEKQTDLQHMVQDKERLQEAIQQIGNNSWEKVGLFNYRHYLPVPYGNTIKVIDDENYYSEFWLVMAREVDLWEAYAGTLTFVWLSCFIAFFIVSTILSRQTYKTYKKREDLERQRQDTTNALAHDLKTPLSIISGYAQNLIENVHTEKKEYYATNIQANVDRMDKIIMEMLELSRLESGTSSIKCESVSLGEVGAEIIKRYKQVCDDKSITAYLEGEAVIQANHSLIERVVDNFFVNALDHTPIGGTIRISIRHNTFEIYNSGSYIAENKIDEIWLPYTKGDTSRGNTKGTGLGLAISRAILELYKFSYGVQNVDKGVLFWFKRPF